MLLNEAKSILNKGNKQYSDMQIQNILKLFDLLAILNIKQFLKKS